MTTSFLFQIHDRHMCHDIFKAFQSVYPDAVFDHIKNTITVEVTTESNPPFMTQLYKNVRDEYYRLLGMSDTERDHFAQYPQPSGVPVMVEEPRIAADFLETNYLPFAGGKVETGSTAEAAENMRDDERLKWEEKNKEDDFEYMDLDWSALED